MRCTCRSALALFLCFSLLSLTCVAQPLAEPRSQRSTKQFPEDQPGFPQYPTSQPTNQRGGRTAAAQAAGTASLNFPPDRNDPVALQCDQLTNPVADALRIGDGVSIKHIDVDQALPVCEQAAERQPARARYQYLYARALDAAKRYPEAAAQYAAADQGGDAWASLALGEMYSAGDGVPRDVGQAQRLFFRAGNAGFADAFSEGGALYLNANPPDYSQAIAWFEKAVQGGSPDGMAHLGWMYASGNGEPKDPARALSLFTEAAKGGSVDGMYFMGAVYHEGLGVQQDLATSCQWFIRAAMYENVRAEAQAGYCYYNGIGVAPDHAAAFNWFTKAGQAGLVDSRVYVADMLERGDGWNQDSAAAVRWYQAAAEQGNVYAMTELGAHLRLGKGVAWNEAAAMQWFLKAAQKGYVPAETSLAIGYENGLGQDSGQGRQDYQQAASWFEKAANQDDGYAQLNLGVMYEKGWGVPQNLERAKQLYARAAGSSNAAVAKLGSEYFSDVPASAPPDRTPTRSVASSSKDSSAFWGVVVLGVLAVGVASMLSSGGSNAGNANIGTPGSPNPDPPKWDPNFGKNCTAEVGGWGVTSQQPVFCQY
jgi:TPR repeat protein